MRSDRRMRRPCRWRGEDGNTLLLMPIAMLVMLALAAVVLDYAIAFSAQREAATVADGVARAASGAVDEGRLFDDGTYVVDLGRASQAAAFVLASRPAAERLQMTCAAPRHGATPDVVEIDCRATTDLVFRPALGRDATFSVDVTGTARAADAPG